MSWVTAEEMRAMERRVFAAGMEPGALMDLAADGMARRLLDHFPVAGSATAYLGKGHNAGDAVAVLEILRGHGWQIAIRTVHAEAEVSVLTRQRLRRCGIEANRPAGHAPGPRLLLDGLLGLGSRGGLREPLAGLAAEMEDLRRNAGAIVAAIDLPSGLDPDSGAAASGTVVADLTLTVGAVKAGLLADAAAAHVGRLFRVPLAGLDAPLERRPRLAGPLDFPGLLAPRPHDFHKGRAGRVAILAGSPGFSGAAELCAAGALRGGAGLVTLFLDPDNPARPTPEIMTRRLGSRIEAAFDSPADVVVAGPGLGPLTTPQRQAFEAALAGDSRPVVLDADALNGLAAAGRLDLLGPHHLITPHPGEFARLAPDLAGLPRVESAARFVQRHPCTLLLKGARSVIAAPGGDLRINPTGHAGMASGGQGDVLAGVCGALAAGGLGLADAAMLGAWLCGRAAERAITHGGESEASMTAGDTVRHLGGAFRDWKEGRR